MRTWTTRKLKKDLQGTVLVFALREHIDPRRFFLYLRLAVGILKYLLTFYPAVRGSHFSCQYSCERDLRTEFYPMRGGFVEQFGSEVASN